MASVIETAIANLEKKSATNSSKSGELNPNTGDNSVM